MAYTAGLTTGSKADALRWPAVRVVCFLIVAALVATCAETRFPEMRRITQTDATSNCIGENQDIQCLVDTYIACWVRHIPALCEKIGAEKPAPWAGGDNPIISGEYTVPRVLPVEPEHIPCELQGANLARPDVVQVEVSDSYCTKGASGRCDWDGYFTLYAKQEDTGWRVLGEFRAWFEDFRDTDCPN